MLKTTSIEVTKKEVADEAELKFSEMGDTLIECVKAAVEEVENKRQITYCGSVDLWFGHSRYRNLDCTLWRERKFLEKSQHIQLKRDVPEGERSWYGDDRVYACVYLYYPIDPINGRIARVGVVINGFRMVEGLKEDLANAIIAQVMERCKDSFISRFYTMREAIESTFKDNSHNDSNIHFSLAEALELGKKIGISDNYLVGQTLDDLYIAGKLACVCADGDDSKYAPSRNKYSSFYFL